METPMRTTTIPSRFLVKTNNNSTTTDARSITPPPAYNRVVGPNIDLSRAVRLGNSSVSVDTSEDEDSDLESLSAINFRINTSVTVSGDNNTVCLADTIESSAKANADAFLKALKDGSAGKCGIPMIDEEGRPRPLTIHVDAGLIITGAGNLIGDEAAVANLSRRRQEDSDDDDDDSRASSPAKRICMGL
ncbi:hypothetical protein CP533_6552 [Ophiocordyceps camponoti-saundersi (nom. inval.)]|nr:hypothetical protein CP533_6552 [Ophiocordyceps camponoti-saundersi (nom. inval.)]